ncbi:uncharacterized protein LOC129763364 [Toxorhynchites rutilus septentrionalis]|uniref:uncharacterized protein LOC129763364 n=1 Tax=Toxorhynchites rutilus septentrionalis TaxID=329112 RepID=UPI0024791D4D|nr:uncharacterized protein LOC129763364 [Toxorhynchites rutilus septentrionalis]
MSAISKYWNEFVTPEVSCTLIAHPGKSCVEHNLSQMRTTVLGNMQFFIPVSLLRLFLLVYSRKAIKWEIVRQTLLEFCCMVANGWSASNSWTVGFCAMYNIFGRMINNYCVSLPGLAGSLVMFWMPLYVQSSHSRAVFNVFLECWIKSREHPLLEYARESKVIGTVAFMIISAVIGYFAQRTKTAEFWFFSPLKKNLNSAIDQTTKPCFHRNDCLHYILEGMKTCFTFGMILELARKLIGSAAKIRRQPAMVLRSISSIRFKFVAFLTLYNGLFRLATCLLARFRGKVSMSDSTLAGAVSGLSYSLSPNYNVFNLAVTAMAQNCWNFLGEMYTRSKAIQRLHQLPISSIVWVILINYNLYSRAYYPYAMSKYALKFTDMCSYSQARTASANLAKLFLGAI